MYQEYGINEKLEQIAIKAEKEIQKELKEIDENAMYNSIKVLKAFQNNEVSEMHFGTSTGYGEGDVRKKLH